MRKKNRKVAKHCVFSNVCGSRGWKSRLAKAAGAEPFGEMRHEQIACGCGAKCILKSARKTPQLPSTLGH